MITTARATSMAIVSAGVVCALGAFSLEPAPLPAPATVVSGFQITPSALEDSSAVLLQEAAFARDQEGVGMPDLNGNEVRDAVSRFKLDDAGDLYEVHSPQTELPNLASPTG